MEIQGDIISRRVTAKNPSKIQWFALQPRHRVGNGEIENEPLSMTTEDDLLSCTIYGRDNNLLDQPGCIRFKSLSRGEKKLLRL